MFFHLLLAVYMAMFLAPVMASDVTVATVNSWGFVFTMACIAIATLSIGYGICYVCLSGRFCIEFPKNVRHARGGFCGLPGRLLGLELHSVRIVPQSIVPSRFLQNDRPRHGGANSQTNTAYVCWWCDWMHLLVGSGVPRSSEEAVRVLVTKATTPPAHDGQDKSATPPPPVGQAQAGGCRAKPQAESRRRERPQQAKVVAVPQEVKAVDPQRRPGESWEEEFARRHVVVNSSKDVAAAIANPQVKIIEIADTFTADKFDPKQTGPFQRWASEGGVVWASNDVLTLFGINHSKLVWWGGGLECTASKGKTPILADCQKVVLKDAGGKAHALTAKGAVPLLVLEKDIPFEDKAGTACWSLVPYGKGWVSDPKPVDTTQYDGGQFWPNFCQFCLGRELVAATAATKPVAVETPTPAATAQQRSFRHLAGIDGLQVPHLRRGRGGHD